MASAKLGMFFAKATSSDPYLQTACLLMADLPTKMAFHNVCFSTLTSLMANFIAFETELGITIETVVSVLSAENAIRSTALIGALARHMPEFLAISALYGRI